MIEQLVVFFVVEGVLAAVVVWVYFCVRWQGYQTSLFRADCPLLLYLSLNCDHFCLKVDFFCEIMRMSPPLYDALDCVDDQAGHMLHGVVIVGTVLILYVCWRQQLSSPVDVRALHLQRQVDYSGQCD